jgi:AcrR family transcriptional regulator
MSTTSAARAKKNPPLEPASAARRAPAQQRSRERMDRILDMATALITAKGSEHLKMSELAESAGISIGSLYQYFPDKQAVIRTLAERYVELNRRCIEDALTGVGTRAQLLKAFSDLVDLYYRECLAQPAMRDIWAGMQADKQLVALELAESKAMGALLAEAMLRASPKADPKQAAATAFLVWQLGEATMRLALAHSRSEGQALVEIYKTMGLRAIAEAG